MNVVTSWQRLCLSSALVAATACATAPHGAPLATARQPVEARDPDGELAPTPKYDPAEFRTVLGPPCEPPDNPPTVRNRTDFGLFERYEEYQRAEAKDPNDGISVSLRFCGDLASIMALGVEINGPVWEPGSVSIIVRYSDLQRIVEHPGVLWLAAGREPQID